MISKLKGELKKLLFSIILGSLKRSARSLIENKPVTVVGVTGSVGKTSFIYLLDAVMRDEMKTKTTFKGNSESGLPLEILGIRSWLKNYSLVNWFIIFFTTPFVYLWNRFVFDYKLLIAEMGVDSPKPPKNMGYLLEIIKPDIGVFLSISPTHTQQFSEDLDFAQNDKTSLLRAIAHEKGKLVTTLDSRSYAIINSDSPFIQELIPEIKAKIITFGAGEAARFRLIKYNVFIHSTSYVFSFDGNKHQLNIDGYLLSREYGYTVLAVIATAFTLGINIEKTIAKIETHFQLPPGRMSLISGKNDITILDSSYNSSPLALKSVIQSVGSFPSQGKKVFILGDMRELGPLAEEEHKKLADLVSTYADEVILVGPLMKQYLLPELKKRKMRVESFHTAKGVGDYLLNAKRLHKNDLVVVKGSQNNIFLEQVVLELMEEPSEAKNILCRQSEYWDRVRKKYFDETSK